MEEDILQAGNGASRRMLFLASSSTTKTLYYQVDAKVLVYAIISSL